MLNLVTIFPNRKARNIFFILVFGFLFLLGTGQFIISGLWDTLNEASHPRLVANQIIRVYELMQRVSDHRLVVVPHFFEQITIAESPTAAGEKLINPDRTTIMAWLDLHPLGGNLALQLGDNKWLNLSIKFSKLSFWLPFTGLALLIVLLLLSLVGFCLIVVRYLAQPLAGLSRVISGLKKNELVVLPAIGDDEADRVIDVFNQMQLAVKKIIELRTQMLTAISHDLRTPITRLKLRAEYLADQNQYRKTLADLEEMEQMITSVLTFMREGVHQGAIKEELDLNALLDSVCNDFSDAGFTVSYCGLNERLPFCGSLSSLRRAFGNLIDNALKYGKSAAVKLIYDQQQIRVMIDDQGLGIPEQFLECVFDPFYRLETSRSRQTGGAGLGLTIARDIILEHQGNIQLMNLSHGGLRVIVIFNLSSL